MKLTNREEKYFKDLTQLIAPSGCENEVAYYLNNEYQKLGYEIVKDNLGSIFALKKSKNSNAFKVMICGHMDEVGFYVKNILPNGMIKPVVVGGLNFNSLQAQRLILINEKGEKIFGVIDTTPPHLLKSTNNTLTESDLLFDFGFSSKEEALNCGVQIGCPVVCEGRFEYTYNKENIIAKAIDDRYGLVLGLEILNELKDVDLPLTYMLEELFKKKLEQEEL